MKRRYLVLCTIALLPACDDGRSTLAPIGDGRFTETFNVTTTTLQPNGVVVYGGAGTVPSIKVEAAGPLDATVSFGAVPGCEFEFSLRIPILLTGGNLVFDSRGMGPELSLHGDVKFAGNYWLTMRANPTSPCTLPPQGMPFPHTIVVTHP